MLEIINTFPTNIALSNIVSRIKKGNKNKLSDSSVSDFISVSIAERKRLNYFTFIELMVIILCQDLIAN